MFRIETNGVNLDEIGRKEGAVTLDARTAAASATGNGIH